jgi:HAMP domain-containing protein
MGSNSSTLVISIAIGILLLLILLLLLSYNSKAKSDKIERFEDNDDDEEVNSLPSMDGFYGGTNGLKNYEHFANNGIINKEGYADRRRNQKPPQGSTEVNEPFANMEGSPLANSYSLLGNDPSGMGSSYKDPSSCYKRDRLTATDLLPTDASSKWAQINPSSSGDLSDQNFLTAGYHVGINTQGTSMRNANLQLRSEVPNPQVAVSPWLISTIEPDVRAVSFEIGSAPQTPPA